MERKVTIDDLAATSGKYDDGSFTLPYDDKLTIINAELESKQTSLRNIAILLADDNQPVKLTPALVQEQLGLNPASYDLLTAESSLTDNKRLAHAVKLTVSQLNKLIADIQANSQSTNEQILTVLSEYVRLNHQYGLSVDQLSAIFIKINDNATNEIIPRLFGLSLLQAEMLLTLSDKPEVMKNIAQGDASIILSAISELENIVQWIREQKLDLAAINAMLTTQYSATATPELFNFLSNIYHSVDNQADAELSKQSLCRSLAAGFHLKTEIVTGLVSWLISNDAEFSLDKFNLAITEVFSDNPTLEKLEHHPLLLTQCQQLSQYVLIAQWAELTPQDIDLLLQPQLVTSSEKPLCPSLSLLRLLADFKAWQQQVKVPVSEALRYFPLFGIQGELSKLQQKSEELIAKLASEENKIKEKKESEEKTINNRLEKETAPLRNQIEKYNEELKTLRKGLSITSDFVIREKIQNLMNMINILGYKIAGLIEKSNRDLEWYSSKYQIEFDSLIKIRNEINKIQWEIKHFPSRKDTIAKIHGWNYKEIADVIEHIFPNKAPITVVTVNKLVKNIDTISKFEISDTDLFNLKELTQDTDSKRIKTLINSIAKSLISRF